MLNDEERNRFPRTDERFEIVKAFLCLCLFAAPLWAQSYVGIDRNDYPGDAAIASLRQTFYFTGYWLNAPPGEMSSSWLGKRAAIERSGLGFLLLWNGKSENEITASGDAKALGTKEGTASAMMALKEGFRKGAILFLDQEEGGRLTQPQRDFLFAWVDAVITGGYSAGVYCSGIPFQESPRIAIRTDDDIREHVGARKLHFFVYNDPCPPAPGCVAHGSLTAEVAGRDAEVWQYAQSPRRAQYTAACAKTYAADGNCYAPGTQLIVDLDLASSADPSHAR